MKEHLCKKCINKYECSWYKDYGPSKLLLGCNSRIAEGRKGGLGLWIVL